MLIMPSYLGPWHEWKEVYPFAEDTLPPDMPEPRGKAVQITVFVNALHAANLVTRQSRTGVLIFVQRAPIVWHSKKQNSIETSTFGSEFMVLKTGVELLEARGTTLQVVNDGSTHRRVYANQSGQYVGC
jgi:hypothetical protein